MNKNQEHLLVKSLLNETRQTEEEQLTHLLTSDTQAIDSLNDWKKIYLLLQNFNPQFSRYFIKHTLNRLAHQRLIQQTQRDLYKWMLRLSMSAVAAVFLLLMYVIWQENSLSIDGLLGITNLWSGDFTNLLANY